MLATDRLSRREYLNRSALGLAGLTLGSLPALNVFGQEKRSGKLTIRDLKPIVLANQIILVQVFTDQGIVGWGECSPMGYKQIVPLVEWLREIVVGEGSGLQRCQAESGFALGLRRATG